MLFPVFPVTDLATRYFPERLIPGAFLIALFVNDAAVAADVKNEIPTRIKRSAQPSKAKVSGYHNAVQSPSRARTDELHLLKPEQPKTDEERVRYSVEKKQLPKILIELKDGNFGKAERMLSELANSMPVGSASRICYERLVAMCSERMDSEYWYRYDTREIRKEKAIKSLEYKENAVAVPLKVAGVDDASQLHNLRNEAWLLLTAGQKP